jgi:hypothetical protein
VEAHHAGSAEAGSNEEFLVNRIKKGVRALVDASPAERNALLEDLLEWIRMGKGEEGLLPLELGLRMPPTAPPPLRINQTGERHLASRAVIRLYPGGAEGGPGAQAERRHLLNCSMAGLPKHRTPGVSQGFVST